MANGSGFEDDIISAKGMRIVHLSYAHLMDYDDPLKWLNEIDFFTTLVEEMAKDGDIKSIHCINYSGVLKRNGAEYHFVKCNEFEITFPLRLHRYVSSLKPEVIIVHGIHFPLQVLLLRSAIKSAKIIVQHHSETPLRHVKALLQRRVDRFTSAYFFPSVQQAIPWIDAGQIASTDKVHEVTEVPSVFYPINKEEAKAVTKVQGSKIYLWVGRFDKNKDPVTLIKAFIMFARVVQDAALYVVFRSYELIEEVKALLYDAKDVSNRITLVGKVHHDDLLYWFNSADFIVSTSHYEGMGIAVCEGMSCGCIPVLSDIPSFKKMTGNGICGMHFSAGDVDDLRNKLSYSDGIDIPSYRDKVLAQYEETMSAKAISRKMISVCEDVVKLR